MAPQPRLLFPVLPTLGGIAPKQAHALECQPPDNPGRETYSAHNSPANDEVTQALTEK